MTDIIDNQCLFNEALNQPWPLLGSGLFSSEISSNRIESAKIIWLLLQDAFINQRINLGLPIIPQLHQLDSSLCLSHKIINRLEFIDLYYQQLSQHAYLDNDVLQLLHQLRPALLRSILYSDNFINKSCHPLRIIIKDLCQFGIGWDSTIGKSGEKYFDSLKNLATIGIHIPENCHQLPAEYFSILDILDDLTTRYIHLEWRILENEKTTIENFTLQRQVEAIIDEYVAGKPMPIMAISFFHEIWKDILYRELILNNSRDKEWKEILNLMDQLVFCLSPQPNSKQEQIKMIPDMIKNLKKILKKSGFNTSYDFSFDIIINILKQVMMGETIPMQITPPISRLKIDGIATIISSSISKQVIQLNLGQWILCKNNNGEMVRYRIAGIFPEAGQVFLVNLLGAKLMKKSIEELGLSITTKRSQLLVSKNLSDNLLSSAIDFFIRNYRKFISETAPYPVDHFRIKSAEKAQAEAQKLRETAKGKSVVIPLPESQGSRIEAMVHNLKVGSWLSLKNRNGEKTACKISVIYGSSGKMVVSDKIGLRVGEYQRCELVDLIIKGEASIIEMADSFEDSLSKVLKTLRKTHD